MATPDIVERLDKRAEKIGQYIASSQIVVDLLQPQMELFDKREGGHDIYTVRMAVDHQSSIRTQTKEMAEITDAAEEIRTLRTRLAQWEKVAGEMAGALGKLAGNAGALGAFEYEIREAAGNTNWQCMKDSTAQADAALTTYRNLKGQSDGNG